ARLNASPALADQPLVEADLRMVIGEGYDDLEVYDAAERHFRRAQDLRTGVLGPDHRATLAARNRRAYSMCEGGRLDEAEPAARAAAGDCARVLGEADEETGRALAILGQVLVDRGKAAE